MPYDIRDRLPTDLQQRAQSCDNRQQQQDNGTHEFQPRPQLGDTPASDDAQYSLSAYLERCRQRGELPRPRPGLNQPRQRPELRLAK